MNVAEIEILAPATRSGAPEGAGPEAAAAEPFDRVLARRAAEAHDARPGRPGRPTRDDASPRTTDPETAPEARTRDADAEPADEAIAQKTDDTAGDDADTDGDGKAKAAAIGPGGACGPAAPTIEAKGEGCTPGSAKAATPKAAVPVPAVNAKAQGTPASATTAVTSKASASTGTPSAPTSAPADATAEATPPAATAATATPDGGDTGEAADGSDDGRPGARRAAARGHAADAKTDAAPAPPAPDRADPGLARAMQQAAAPAQAALARAAEAAAHRHGDADAPGAHGGGPDKADALGSSSGTTDAAPRVTADLRAVRTDAARHAPAFDQVMDHTLRMVRLGTHEARLRLEPDHLGEVRVRISVDRGHVVADLTVHTHATRDLLEGQQARLQQALLDGGADGARVNVSLGGDQGRDAPEEGPAPEMEIAAPVPETPTAAVAAAAGEPGGLSIRA